MATAALAALLLSGCVSNDDRLASLVVAPGKYQYYKCSQIAVAMQNNIARARQLRELIAKAGRGVGGRVVSATVYEPQYLTVRGELNDLRAAARAQHCTLPPAVARAAGR